MYISQEVLRPQKVHPCEKWSQKGLSPRIHSNAEDSQAEDFTTLPKILRPRVYSIDRTGRKILRPSFCTSARCLVSTNRVRSGHPQANHATLLLFRAVFS